MADAALSLVAEFLLLDLLHYLVHRLEHAVPFFWRIHAPHHSDPDVDVTTAVRHHPIEISMDGRGRCHDNIFVERLWWIVKHEWVCLRPAANGSEQKRSLGEFFDWYNPASSHPSRYVAEEKRFC
jgi:transposase InsO family protein